MANKFASCYVQFLDQIGFFESFSSGTFLHEEWHENMSVADEFKKITTLIKA